MPEEHRLWLSGNKNFLQWVKRGSGGSPAGRQAPRHAKGASGSGLGPEERRDRDEARTRDDAQRRRRVIPISTVVDDDENLVSGEKCSPKAVRLKAPWRQAECKEQQIAGGSRRKRLCRSDENEAGQERAQVRLPCPERGESCIPATLSCAKCCARNVAKARSVMSAGSRPPPRWWRPGPIGGSPPKDQHSERSTR